MEQLGPRRSAAIPSHVGAVLSGSQRHRVRFCAGPFPCHPGLTNPFRFIVDSADRAAIPVAKEELHLLLQYPAIQGIPLLVLGNKSDLPNHLDVDDIIDQLQLKLVKHREVSCYGISAKEETNLDAVLEWLTRRADG